MEVTNRVLLLLSSLLLPPLLLGGCTGVQAKVMTSSNGPDEKCSFPDGAVGRCEEVRTCQRDGGVMRRQKIIVLCDPPPAGGIYVCCRRPKLVAKEMCRAWTPYWTYLTHFVPRIYGGKEAAMGEFPNMAAIGVGEGPINVKWECGGSLITPLFVLTAAHCIENRSLKPNAVRWVGLGVHDFTKRSDKKLPRLDLGGLPDGLLGMEKIRGRTNARAPAEQIIQIEKTFQYPQYQKSYHDIALVQLKTPATLTSGVLPSCLPSVGLKRYGDGSKFTVAGWGNTKFDGIAGLDHALQKVTIQIIDPNLCYEDLNFHKPPLGITGDIICAGATDKDSCQGDSGGPLMVGAGTAKDQFYGPRVVAGVVSFGIGCMKAGFYTSTFSYLDWITGIVAPQLLPAA